MFEAELIAKLYEAAVEPDGLEQMSLLVRQALSLDSAGFWLIREGNVVELVNTPDIRASEPAYLARYHALDPWTDHDPSRFGVVTLASERFPETDLVSTEFYQDFARHYGMIRPMGVTIDLSDGLLATVAANRIAPGILLNHEDKAKMQMLVVHLTAALRLRMKFVALQTLSTIREEALDALSFALVICDTYGRVAFANRQAEAAAAGSGPFRLVDGRVVARHASERSRLELALNKTVRGEASGLQLRNSEGNPIVITITPAPPRLTSLPGRVVLSLARDKKDAPDRKFSDAFGLTPAQADLCNYLAAGFTFEEAADAKGVKLSTMRSHFKIILERTGAKNLRDLLRMMASLPQVSSLFTLALIS